MAKKTILRTKLSKAAKAKVTAHALHERIKELTCLYTISQISEKNAASPDKVFQGIAAAIPPAWQYPEAAAARIVLDGKSYVSSNFEEGRHKMAAPVISAGKRRGMVEVVYVRPVDTDTRLFLKEERSLLAAITRHVVYVVERQEAEAQKAELQKQLIHADRLATIGQLAAGVAHELNEPLSNILGFAQLVCKHPGLPVESARDLERIVDASLYAREIIKKLLLFARQTAACKGLIDLNDTVSEALELFEYRFEKEGIRLVRDFSPRLPSIVADPGQLKQVIVNLVVNAIQAMQGGGVVTVRTNSDSTHFLCTVEDTGTGMTEEIIEHIFVPFFTTKDVDQGTGLGLPMAHGIIASHGGTIEVESSPGKGTTFTIRLPMETVSGQRKANE